MIKPFLSHLSIVFCTLLLFTAGNITAQVNIIPLPRHLVVKEEVFILDAKTSLDYKIANDSLKTLANYFTGYIESISGFRLALHQKKAKRIQLAFAKTDLGAEAYELTVSPGTIQIKASSNAGFFYAFQSLFQSLPAIRTNDVLRIPCMEIADAPAFKWRGFMLDVSRHFYSVEAIKEVLDLLSLYKINKFHWHLTDNEGWRIEIKKYPKLTAVGAFREEYPGNVFYKKDSTLPAGQVYRYGGYYTQEQAREIAAYAAARSIEVIPEIEMPGHSGAALSAYPEFSCSHKARAVPTASFWSGRINPADMNVNYCAGNDSSFLFLQNVLDEIMKIFPSAYIHIGGDEVDKTYWENCERCKQRMQENKLGTAEELQSYFVKRMEKYLLLHHKKLLGWDEILEGGLAASATVMSWRGEKGGIAAAKQNHPVVMSPSNPMYFNRYQTDAADEPFAAAASINTLSKVYSYHPQPTDLTDLEQKLILGGQAAMWTEFISSVEHLKYMLLPRLPALAEVLWTPVAQKDFGSFVQRLNAWHFIAWQQKGIRFHPGWFNSRMHEATGK